MLRTYVSDSQDDSRSLSERPGLATSIAYLGITQYVYYSTVPEVRNPMGQLSEGVPQVPPKYATLT